MRQELWLDANQNRYFLIPDDQDLPGGSFLIQTLNGEKKEVDALTLAGFEVTQKEARRHIHAQAKQILRQIKHTFSSYSDTMEPESKAGPTTASGMLTGFLSALKAILLGVVSNDPAQHRRARAQMHLLRARLKTYRIESDEALEHLPDRLREQYQAADQRAQLAESAAALEIATVQLSESLSSASKGRWAAIAEIWKLARQSSIRQSENAANSATEEDETQ